MDGATAADLGSEYSLVKRHQEKSKKSRKMLHLRMGISLLIFLYLTECKTIPVRRWAVRGTKRSSTPAWMVLKANLSRLLAFSTNGKTFRNIALPFCENPWHWGSQPIVNPLFCLFNQGLTEDLNRLGNQCFIVQEAPEALMISNKKM